MLTVGERETRLSMMGDDHGTWDVFTDDPFWIARLDKIATAWKVIGGARWYKIPARQVTFRAPAKPPTEAQIEIRRKAGERLRKRQDGV
jgi:hypothetical protein